MIYEYAIEPEFLVRLAKLRYKNPYFVENEWGPGTHRFCVKLFDDWSEVRNKAEFSLLEETLFEYYFTKIVNEAKINRNTEKIDWDPNRKWVDNLSQYNDANHPYRVRMAFAKNHPKGRPYFTVSDLRLERRRVETEFLKLWYPDSYDEEKNRSAKNLVELVKVFLCASSSITWIDPYIRMVPRYISVFSEIFKLIIESGEIFRKTHSFTVISKFDEERRDLKEFWRQFENRVAAFIPENTVLTFILADEGTKYKLHDRYMISELGGFEFPGGTDERRSEDRWSINLMTKNKWRIKGRYYSKYNGVNGCDRQYITVRDRRTFYGKNSGRREYSRIR